MQGQPLDPVQQKRAMEDPEVAKIVQDPAMAQVLKEMQTDPKAAAKYLQDPVVQEKLNTLVYAGIVRLGWSVCLRSIGRYSECVETKRVRSSIVV